MNAVLDAALQYIDRGWWVFPLHGIDKKTRACTCGTTNCSDAGKHPKIQNGLKGASRDKEQIEEWFADGTANIAVVTGEKSGITVLDIDVGKKKGDQTWADLNKDKGEPQTLMAVTGSGGMHVYFRYNSALNTSGNTLGQGIDCRNDDGYVVAPPSSHKSGGSYEWLNADDAIADLPAHLARKKRRGRPKKDDPTKRKYAIEQVAEMLKHISADDRDVWRKVGIVLGREFAMSEVAWQTYNEWSDTWGGAKGRSHDAIMRQAFYEISQQDGDSELSIATIIRLAIDNGWAPVTGTLPIENFLYWAPGNNFIYRPTRANWPAESVDATCSPVNEAGAIVKPSAWLKANRAVTSMTSDPLITEEVSTGFDCIDGALVPAVGAALFNAYRPSQLEPGDAKLAGPFFEHVRRVFSKQGDADMFLDYMAHRVQKPGEKPRFALLIAGEQGVGKDTAILMCVPAIGVWNVANIEPATLEGGFNEYAAKVLIVISEAANVHEMNKWAFNERTKVLIAGSPDYITINPKYGHKYSVRLHNGTIVTTNHMMSGIYLPPDDRRYDVIEAATRAEMGLGDAEQRTLYFTMLWDWFASPGAAGHVLAALLERDISKFRAATGQRITEAHRAVVQSGMIGDEWARDAITTLGDPDAFTLEQLRAALVQLGHDDKLKKPTAIANAVGRSGYVKIRNANSSDGRWMLLNADGKWRCWSVIYGRRELELPRLLALANALCNAENSAF